MWASRALVLSIVVGVAGCATPAQRGSTLYQQERYVEAEELFVHTEREVQTSRPPERAEYALYRGLTLLELGEYSAAHHWLDLASRVERAHPRSLSGRERKMLGAGFARLERDARPTVPTVAAGAPAPSAAEPAAATAAAIPTDTRRSLR